MYGQLYFLVNACFNFLLQFPRCICEHCQTMDKGTESLCCKECEKTGIKLVSIYLIEMSLFHVSLIIRDFRVFALTLMFYKWLG